MGANGNCVDIRAHMIYHKVSVMFDRYFILISTDVYTGCLIHNE